jgi:hypothetical protein
VLDVRYLHSPGSVAGQLLTRMGVVAPLDKFAIPDDEALDHWQQGMHGGWCAVHVARTPVPACEVDIISAYATAGSLIDWWAYFSAARIVEEDCTDEFHAFLHDDRLLEDLFDPDTWRRWGCTLVEVRPSGQPFPAQLQRDLEVEPHLEVVPLTLDGTLFYPWPDVVLATLLAATPPEIVSATRLVPVGRQANLRPVTVRDDFVIDPVEDDPAVACAVRRRQAQREGDTQYAAVLRLVVNSLNFGQPSRYDPTWQRQGRRLERAEQPGAWCWPPVAATVPAACRLLLAMLECLLTNEGGHIAYRDTDGATIISSPHGGSVPLPHGATVQALSWSQTDGILERFEPLGVSDGSFWRTRRGNRGHPWWGVFYAPKRWTFFTLQPGGGVTLEDASRHGLAGTVLSPPHAGDWSSNVAEQLVANTYDPETAAAPFGWEHDHPDFAAMRRRSVTRPDDLDTLPAGLGLRPFAAYLEATSTIPGTAGPVAPDWGDQSHWAALPWHGRDDAPIRATTDLNDITAVQVEPLATKAAAWGGHELLHPAGLVTPTPARAHPALIRRVGRAGGKYRGDSKQLIYTDLDIPLLLRDAAQELGPLTVANLTGLAAHTINALGTTRMRPSTITRAIAGLTQSFPDARDPLAALIGRISDGRACKGCRARLAGRKRSWCSDACRIAAARGADARIK